MSARLPGGPILSWNTSPAATWPSTSTARRSPCVWRHNLLKCWRRAVQVAHANGVVHRDLKPANILLIPAAWRARMIRLVVASSSPHGSPLTRSPKLPISAWRRSRYGDWEAHRHRSLTVTGDLLGTPSYMAPEQAAPNGPPVGPAADIYALGAILYELLTGRPPFKGETPLDTVLQVLHSEPVSVTDLQPNVPAGSRDDLPQVFAKGTAPSLSNAPVSWRMTCRAFLRGEPIKARPRGTVEKVWRWIRDHPCPQALSLPAC